MKSDIGRLATGNDQNNNKNTQSVSLYKRIREIFKACVFHFFLSRFKISKRNKEEKQNVLRWIFSENQLNSK